MTAGDHLLESEGDLEAVTLAESFAVLSSIVGPYMYTVVGKAGDQQAAFRTSELQALFFIRVHEFLADATDVSVGNAKPRSLSLLSAGAWLSERYPDEAKRAGFDSACRSAIAWFRRNERLVFWAPSIDRHLRLELSMSTLIAMRANFEKHQLLRLQSELRRLRTKCQQSGCPLTPIEAVMVREEFEAHVVGMLAYHATEVAEIVGRYFLGLFRLVRNRFLLQPTHVLDDVRCPPEISDDLFRYMYASTIVGLARWEESRIYMSIPETSPSFRRPYPQHKDWAAPEFGQSAP